MLLTPQKILNRKYFILQKETSGGQSTNYEFK